MFVCGLGKKIERVRVGGHGVVNKLRKTLMSEWVRTRLARQTDWRQEAREGKDRDSNICSVHIQRSHQKPIVLYFVRLLPVLLCPNTTPAITVN